MYFDFDPQLESPFCVIHPLQVSAVKTLLSRDIPARVVAIILFGSSLDLTCSPKSDIDLAVVFEDASDEMVTNQMYMQCKNLGRPFDMLPLDISDLEEPLFGSIEWRILHEGIIIYAKE